MWCLDSCDEPVIQFSQVSDMVGTHPVGSYPCEVPVFRVEEAGESRDVLLGPGQGSRDDHDDELGYPAYSHHDRFPPWWVFVRDDYGGNLSGDKFPP